MKAAIDKLPNDPQLLKQIIVEGLEQRDQEIALLKEQIAYLKQQLFGRKSEKRPSDGSCIQLTFDLGEELEEAKEVVVEEIVEIPAHKRRKRGRKPLSDKLPREERIIDIPEEDKICECGCKKSVIGNETSEHLQYIPARCKVIVNIRPKYACRNCEGTESDKPAVMIAPPPAQIIPKSFATASLLAYMLTSKYVDSLPFYRLSNMLNRHGVQISRATMCNWTFKVTSLLKPMIDLFIEQILNSSYIHADETPFQVLKESGRKPEQKSYMWVFKTGYSEKPTILFHYSPSRGEKIPKQILEKFEGYIQTDGYSGYNFTDENKKQIRLGCWAHLRRKFNDSVKALGKHAKPGIAHEALSIISSLYKIEKEVRDLSSEKIKQARQTKARIIIDGLKNKLDRWNVAVLPKSLTGKAVNYALNQWDKLIVYLEDGRLQIDNNPAERAIRPFATGRKNWLFCDTQQGAMATATAYSIIETAKANDIDPFWYIFTLLEKLPDLKTKEDFIPWMPQNIDKQVIEKIKQMNQI